jgi:hypothetical protein
MAPHRLVAALALLSLSIAPAHAQQYPSAPANVTVWLLVLSTNLSHSIDMRHTPYPTEEACAAAAQRLGAGRTDGTRAYCVARYVPCGVQVRDVGGWAAGHVAACPPPPPQKEEAVAKDKAKPPAK